MGSRTKVPLYILVTCLMLCCIETGVTVHASMLGITGTITVGGFPDRLVFDSGTGEVFVQNKVDGTISVISDSNDTVIATLPVGQYPQGMAYDSIKGEVFESDGGGVSGPPIVQVISDKTYSVVAIIPNAIGNMAFDSAKDEVFVNHYQTDDIWVISDATNAPIASIPVGFVPTDIIFDSGRGEIWVDNGSYSVSIISDTTNTVVSTINIGGNPGFASTMAYDSVKGEIFLTLMGSVVVISDSTNTELATVPADAPMSVAYASARAEIYVANYNSNTTSVISDSNDSIVSNISVDFPYYLTYDSGKNEVFVASGAEHLTESFVSNTVSIISNYSELASPTPSSTPSIPELTWLIIAPLLLSMLSVAVVLRHRKTANLNK